MPSAVKRPIRRAFQIAPASGTTLCTRSSPVPTPGRTTLRPTIATTLPSTITVSPGGTKVPITPAGTIPLCSDLPAIYNYTYYSGLCSDEIANGAIFASANLTPPKQQPAWACQVAPGTVQNPGGIPAGVLCSWAPLTPP